MNQAVSLGIPKGRLFQQVIDVLDAAGVKIAAEELDSRKLIFRDTAQRCTFVALKPVDIPVYVEAGVLDAGVVGTDILNEHPIDVYEPLNLHIGKCTMCLAAKQGAVFPAGTQMRIATKYPATAQRYFLARRHHVQIIRLEGSVEIAPLVGLADAIVDLVETGRTLRENGLEIRETIADVSAKLIVNRTAMKIQPGNIAALIAQLDAVVYANS